MMRYIASASTDPYFNLALEQYVFDELDPAHSYFMLWQNDNAIIVGKHQNTIAEINPAFVEEKGITVARRLSGGGAVYHDMGNLNFTFIVDAEGTGFDFATFCRPVVNALASLGVTAEISGRNDMTIDGKKFSGNAQYSKRGRVMHHGTLMYDSDLSVLAGALQVSKDKIESKGIASVRSRVTNIKPHMRENLPLAAFWAALRDYMFKENPCEAYTLTEKDLAAVKKLRAERYSLWDWNFGASPAYAVQKQRRVEGCGKIEVLMEVDKGGAIGGIAFYGDYFGNGDPAELAALLRGQSVRPEALRAALAAVDIGHYFAGLSREAFISILTQ
ncbi:lipoate--protein ligase [Ruminococcaceae bacterium OttesenSCG-928-A11]|nr:lipoate--protein ligase [Ruminococcaceae bacterium OttesenSCG-928-A11]